MTDWIAVDWGTTRLRVWRMTAEGAILDHRTSDQGMGVLDQQGFEPALLDLVGDWITPQTPVIACGMVGAKQGWAEAPYTPVPCDPSQGGWIHVQPRQSDVTVTILSGLSQIKPNPDVMRGEETQIAGFLAQNPKFDGVICLPGTHTKWAHISAQEIVSFQTFMSGELFSLLSNYSVLKHSVISDGWDQNAFSEAVYQAMSHPATIAGKLFGLRAGGLLAQQTPDKARAAMSGYLIGMELAAARPYWLGQDIVMIGDDQLTDLYATALAPQGAMVRRTDATQMTLAGLTAAYHRIKDTQR